MNDNGQMIAAAPKPEGTMAIATTRQAQEVQAAMIVAKNFPRDETAALQRILRSCARPALAELAIYEFPRGGQKVSGPSVRLAEAVAQGWGNIDYGVIELEQKPGESVAMSYAWDLETNVRSTKVFTVSHYREVNDRDHGGKIKKLLTDPRDIYEMVANNGARRMRACILAVIPGDVFDEAEAACERTLKGGGKKPIADRIRDMVIAFGELSVTKEMLEARLGMPVESASETQLAGLRKIFTSLKDGVGQREDFFNTGAPNVAEKPKSRTEAAKNKVAKPAAGSQEQQPTQPRTFKEIEAAVFEAKTQDDVEALRAEISEHKSLTSGEQSQLGEMLIKAEQQFVAQE